MMPFDAHAIRAVVAGAFLLAQSDAVAASQGGPQGLWLSDTKDGVIRVASCGARLCAHLYAILDPKVPQSARDVHNENAALRTRPICGLPLMGKLQKQGPATWGDGWVYDPKVGKTYDVEITLRDPGTLVVHGYIGVKFMGKTIVWTRASSSVTRCTPPKR